MLTGVPVKTQLCVIIPTGDGVSTCPQMCFSRHSGAPVDVLQMCVIIPTGDGVSTCPQVCQSSFRYASRCTTDVYTLTGVPINIQLCVVISTGDGVSTCPQVCCQSSFRCVSRCTSGVFRSPGEATCPLCPPRKHTTRRVLVDRCLSSALT